MPDDQVKLFRPLRTPAGKMPGFASCVRSVFHGNAPKIKFSPKKKFYFGAGASVKGSSHLGVPSGEQNKRRLPYFNQWLFRRESMSCRTIFFDSSDMSFERLVTSADLLISCLVWESARSLRESSTSSLLCSISFLLSFKSPSMDEGWMSRGMAPPCWLGFGLPVLRPQ